jgi:hypothetical protein
MGHGTIVWVSGGAHLGVGLKLVRPGELSQKPHIAAHVTVHWANFVSGQCRWWDCARVCIGTALPSVVVVLWS